MSLSDRRSLILALLATASVASCGFTPAYAPGGPAETLKGKIDIAPPVSETDYVLVKYLETRLGQPDGAIYGLAYSVGLGEVGVGITQAQETTRVQIRGTLSYTLSDLRNGQVLDQSVLSSFTAYAATGSTTATLAATRDARERLMVILGDQLVTRLVAKSGELPQ